MTHKNYTILKIAQSILVTLSILLLLNAGPLQGHALPFTVLDTTHYTSTIHEIKPPYPNPASYQINQIYEYNDTTQILYLSAITNTSNTIQEYQEFYFFNTNTQQLTSITTLPESFHIIDFTDNRLLAYNSTTLAVFDLTQPQNQHQWTYNPFTLTTNSQTDVTVDYYTKSSDSTYWAVIPQNTTTIIAQAQNEELTPIYTINSSTLTTPIEWKHMKQVTNSLLLPFTYDVKTINGTNHVGYWLLRNPT